MSSSLMYEEFRVVGEMATIRVALAQFAKSLSPDGEFKKERKRWIYRPNNFITFGVQPRKGGILLTLRGHPGLYYKNLAEKAGLREDWLKTGSEREYTTYSITSASQLLAAAQFIKWAFEYGRKPRANTAGASP